MNHTSATEARQDCVLDVRGLGKEYRLYDSPRDRLKALITGRAFHRSHWALKEVDFTLRRGQCMGVIGDNGAGKSSLLKLMAGTMHPTTGTLERSGRVTAILELGAGFHPDFTGRDNLYFGGSLIGIAAADMARLESEIIEFSELGVAIDRPVKTYSSGMVVRLAFALVTAVEPDVLIIDEALAVGDQHFQKKCVERIAAFRRRGCTILFCSHSLYHVRQLCDVALWLDGGRARAYGETESVLASYEAHVRAQDGGDDDSHSNSKSVGSNALTGVSLSRSDAAPMSHAAIVDVHVDHLDEAKPPLLHSADLVVHVTVRGREGEQPHVGVMIEQAHGVGITSVGTHTDKVFPVRLDNGLWRATVTFARLPLHTGEYVISAYLFDAEGLVVYEEWPRCVHFKHILPGSTPGLVRLHHEWSQ